MSGINNNCYLLDGSIEKNCNKKHENMKLIKKTSVLAIILFLSSFILATEARAQQKVAVPTSGELGNTYMPTVIDFKSGDGLEIQGNLYEIGKDRPVVLLMHQAGYNRMEYADIAPKLNEMGFNCLAIDLRSGGKFDEKPNVTSQRAKAKGLQTEFIDARQDVKAAIGYLYKRYNQNIIIWGSSYTSSLALLEGAKNDHVKAILSFSPGDYFGDSAPSLATVFANIDKPFFVTSSKSEANAITALRGTSKLKANQSQFIPVSNGYHGSRVLWEGQTGAQEYWAAVTDFLNRVK